MSAGIPHFRLPRRALPDRAAVYTPDEGTTEFTAVDKADLPCRLSTVADGAAATGPERVELAGMRQLYWAEDYALPDTAQVEVNGNGQRWNVMAGSVQEYGGGGTVLYRRISLRRAT